MVPFDQLIVRKLIILRAALRLIHKRIRQFILRQFPENEGEKKN